MSGILAWADHRPRHEYTHWGCRQQVDVNIDVVGEYITNLAGYQIIDLAGWNILDIDWAYIRDENIALIVDRYHIGEIDGAPDPDIQLVTWCYQVIVIQTIAAFGFISTGKEVGTVGGRESGLGLWQ